MIPPESSPPGWIGPALSPFPPRTDAPVPSLSSRSFVKDSLQPTPRSPELYAARQVWPLQYLGEGKDHLSHSAGKTLPNAAQDTIFVAFFATGACLWLILIWCSPGYPGPFLQKIGWPLEYTGAWGFSFPGSGLLSSLCWTLRNSRETTFPACWDLCSSILLVLATLSSCVLLANFQSVHQIP